MGFVPLMPIYGHVSHLAMKGLIRYVMTPISGRIANVRITEVLIIQIVLCLTQLFLLIKYSFQW